MNRDDLRDWFLVWRPGASVSWANEKALLVGSIEEDNIGEYGPSFAVNLTTLPDNEAGEFSALHIATKLSSPYPVSLNFVNELNQNIRFVRHAIFEESSIGVMLDIAEGSNQLTGDVLDKYMFFFIESVKRLKATFPAS